MNYIVLKEGVYIQGVMGVYDDVEQAKERARVCASEDRDDYHTYEVTPISLNEPCDLNSMDEPIFVCRQKSDRQLKADRPIEYVPRKAE